MVSCYMLPEVCFALELLAADAFDAAGLSRLRILSSVMLLFPPVHVVFPSLPIIPPPFNRLTLPTDLTNFMFMHRLVSMTAIENFHQPRRGVKNSEAVCIIPVTHASITLWAASTPALVTPQLHRITRVPPQTDHPAHRPFPPLHYLQISPPT